MSLQAANHEVVCSLDLNLVIAEHFTTQKEACHGAIHHDSELLVSANFHCPACGAEVFTETGNPTDKPCEHLLFSWINEVGEFYNAAEEVCALVEDHGNWILRSQVEFLERCPDTAVLFALSDIGVTGGLSMLTVIHAIKFPEASWDQDDEGR